MLRPHERETLERLERVGNPLGFKPHGRNADGDAILRARLSRGKDGAYRVCFKTLTPTGMIDGSIVYDADGAEVRRRGATYE